MTTVQERALTFSCDGESLLGIAHLPERPSNIGVVFVAGAPQYRVGAHRLFVTLGRELSQSGFPVFRFDVRGLGDSSGRRVSFEEMHDDLVAALAAFKRSSPEVDKIVLLGLCDGASAILLDGVKLTGVEGVVLINTWAQMAEGRTKAMQRSYYLGRLRNWRTWPAALMGRANGARPQDVGTTSKTASSPAVGKTTEVPSFIPKMLDNWLQFRGRSLVVSSQDDVTAAAFDAVVGDRVGWRKLRKQGRVSRAKIKGADHTFSSTRARDALAAKIMGWLRETAL